MDKEYLILKCCIWLDQCTVILECIALNSVLMDKGIFDIKMFYSIESVQIDIGMTILRFGIDG